MGCGSEKKNLKIDDLPEADLGSTQVSGPEQPHLAQLRQASRKLQGLLANLRLPPEFSLQRGQHSHFNLISFKKT